jgi:hypothetical protein
MGNFPLTLAKILGGYVTYRADAEMGAKDGKIAVGFAGIAPSVFAAGMIVQPQSSIYNPSRHATAAKPSKCPARNIAETDHFRPHSCPNQPARSAIPAIDHKSRHYGFKLQNKLESEDGTMVQNVSTTDRMTLTEIMVWFNHGYSRLGQSASRG